jgi:hypothetical protein
VKAHRVAMLGLGAWMYGGAAAWASYVGWPVASFAFACCSLTCAGLMIVGGRR